MPKEAALSSFCSKTAVSVFAVLPETSNLRRLKVRHPFAYIPRPIPHRTYSSFKALASKGVEVVKADLDDPASLAEALKDAHGVYAVTQCKSDLGLSTYIWSECMLQKSGKACRRKRK